MFMGRLESRITGKLNAAPVIFRAFSARGNFNKLERLLFSRASYPKTASHFSGWVQIKNPGVSRGSNS